MDKNRREKGLYWQRAWSLIKGCHPVTEECDHCWLATETAMRQHHPNASIKKANEDLIGNDGHFNGFVRLMEENLSLPLKVRKPTVWAVWSDLFHPGVPYQFRDRAFAVMALCPQHTFIVLTKRADIMRLYMNAKRDWSEAANTVVDPFRHKQEKDRYSPGEIVGPLNNVYLGVTAGSNKTAYRIKDLLLIDGFKKIVSYEPALGPLDISKTVAIDGIVIGCESGPHARETKIEWIRDVKDQCVSAGVPVFVKQAKINGKLVKLPEIDGKVWNRLPWDENA